MGYNGSMTWNGWTIWEGKHQGDFMAAYAKNYNMTKAAIIDKKELKHIPDCQKLLYQSNFEVTIRKISRLIQILTEMITYHYRFYFDKNNQFIGKICSVIISKNFEESLIICDKNMVTKNEIIKNIPASETWKDACKLQEDIRITFSSFRLERSETRCFETTKKSEAFYDKLFHIRRREDVVNLLIMLQERLNEVTETQRKTRQEELYMDKILSEIQTMLENDETLTLRFSEDEIHILSDTGKELRAKTNNKRIFFPLCTSIGISEWNFWCTINSMEEMEKFIRSFSTMKKRKPITEDFITHQFALAKKNNTPIQFSIGGGY